MFRAGRPAVQNRDQRWRAGGTAGTAAEPARIADAKTVGSALIVEAIEAAPQLAAALSDPHGRHDAEIEARTRLGEPPPPFNFSAPAPARFHAKLAALVELAGKADAFGLREVPINPVSSSPKAFARYPRPRGAGDQSLGGAHLRRAPIKP